ncbi:serine palmitoyltransferase component [Marasmius tenuissimus]|nr:serine palmitoyltransferase component [Marasmius tenuissimus]
MAIRSMSPSSGSQSIFKKRSTSSLSPTMATATSYLSAVSEADARARTARSSTPTPTATPALSFASSTSSEHTSDLEEFDDNDDKLMGPLSVPFRPPTSEQVFSTVHTEFGHCASEEYRHTSAHTPGTPIHGHIDKDPPYYILLSTYISYLILIVLGHIRDFLGKRFHPKAYRHLMPHDGYAPLNSDFDSFYTRRLKTRMDECFAQPVTGVAGRTIVLLDRVSLDYNRTQVATGTKTRALNISSYNYLGFAQARGGCADVVEESIKRYGISTCGARLEGGTSELHTVGEKLVAQFVGTEDSLLSSMGFATNSTFIPAIVGKGCLVISDELNHSSIRFGVRFSGAHVRMFKHNDMKSLESLLREVISQGQPRTHRPWRKILLIVEGLYSMEGTMVNLPGIMKLKEKYKFYLFVDEAHSIGAVGPNGRGVADYYNIDPKSIDLLMGTFTKSFGAAGGYVAGKKAIIDRIRVKGYSGPYAEAMSIPVLTQVIASMASIMGVAVPTTSMNNSSLALRNNGSNGHLSVDDEYHHPGPVPVKTLPGWMSLPSELASGEEGRTRLRRLAFNSFYLHRGLDKLGFITYGHPSSPIVPLILFNPGKMMMFHRMMKDREVPIITVVVAYPATPLVTTRVRFCVSAAHTKEDIDCILKACDEIGDVMDIKHGLPKSERWHIDEICARAVELVNLPVDV